MCYHMSLIPAHLQKEVELGKASARQGIHSRRYKRKQNKVELHKLNWEKDEEGGHMKCEDMLSFLFVLFCSVMY